MLTTSDGTIPTVYFFLDDTGYWAFVEGKHYKALSYEALRESIFQGTGKLVHLTMSPLYLSEEDTKQVDSIMRGTNTPKGGTKHDAGKPRPELLPSAALLEVAKVLEFGSRKYEDDNWRKGFKWKRLYGAALRHLLAHKEGEDKDPESGITHLAHATCCLLFLLEHELKGLGEDDRYKYS